MFKNDFYIKNFQAIEEIDNDCFIDIDTGEVVWLSKEEKYEKNLFSIIMTN